MTVYVDKLRAWPTMGHTTGQARRHFGEGRESCHLLAGGLDETNVDELHALAARIGMRRSWFQPLSWPHYDLTPSRRASAVRAGAVERSNGDLARMRLAARADHARLGGAR